MQNRSGPAREGYQHLKSIFQYSSRPIHGLWASLWTEIWQLLPDKTVSLLEVRTERWMTYLWICKKILHANRKHQMTDYYPNVRKLWYKNTAVKASSYRMKTWGRLIVSSTKKNDLKWNDSLFARYLRTVTGRRPGLGTFLMTPVILSAGLSRTRAGRASLKAPLKRKMAQRGQTTAAGSQPLLSHEETAGSGYRRRRPQPDVTASPAAGSPHTAARHRAHPCPPRAGGSPWYGWSAPPSSSAASSAAARLDAERPRGRRGPLGARTPLPPRRRPPSPAEKAAVLPQRRTMGPPSAQAPAPPASRRWSKRRHLA